MIKLFLILLIIWVRIFGMIKKIAILGTVGIPGNYGGFETLAENLARYHLKYNIKLQFYVYCSKYSYNIRPSKFLNTFLTYIPFKANGIQSIFYDIYSIIHAWITGKDCILLLGVSGTIIIPFVKFFSSIRIVTNIDGIEWRREKWTGLAKIFLKFSEKIAVKFSDVVIADNQAIADYVQEEYSIDCHVIAYGGDHAVASNPIPFSIKTPEHYALSLCRIEPENNVEMILTAFSELPSKNLIFVGNWTNSTYGIELKEKFQMFSNIFLFDPIYDLGILKDLRNRASIYIHGHSAGGTNPSLVEMMHFGIPIFAFKCDFNIFSTDNQANYFSTSDEIIEIVSSLSSDMLKKNASSMIAIANSRYTWDKIGKSYFKLLK